MWKCYPKYNLELLININYMKKNRILFTMCAVAALTACTDNELSSVTEGSNTGKAAIELTVAPEVETRGAWYFGDDGGQFKWDENDMIGLSMVSRDKEETITDSHYTLTNYQFTATTGGTVTAYPSVTGYFTTKNATVFSGKYVAYYPYDNTYKDPSKTIPVSSPYIQYTSVKQTVPGTYDEPTSQFAGDHSFAYSQPFAMEGGTEAKAEIKLQNLSGSFMLNLDQDLSEKFGMGGSPISYIIATTGDFDLGKEKKTAGEFPVHGDLKSVIVAPGDEAATYDESQEALILHMSNGTKGSYDTEGTLTIAKDEAVYMVTLPRPDFFSEGYRFYLVDATHKAYEIEKDAATLQAAGYTTIYGKVANFRVKNADVTETKVNNTPVYVAADYASLAALANVNEGSKIYVFNNIILEDNLTFEQGVELIAAKNQGKITVPDGKKLTFTNNSIINTEVEVCGTTTDAGLIADKGLTIGTEGKVTNNTPFVVKTLTQVVVEGEYTNNATFTVEAPAATTSEANRGLKVTGTFNNNNGIVDNYGTVSNVNGEFTNKGDFLDEIGSKLSGTAMKQDGEYICIVDRQARLLEAINQRPSTTIRLKNCAEGVAGYNNRICYDFLNQDWSKYKFEIIGDNVGVQNSDPTTYEGVAKIKSLEVERGAKFTQEDNAQLDITEGLLIKGTTTIKNTCNVGSDVTIIGGEFTITEAKSNLTERMTVAGNLTTVAMGTATFNNNVIVRVLGEQGVVNNIGCKFVITDATETGKVPAIVYAKAFSGNGTWANYPTVVENPEKPYNN